MNCIILLGRVAVSPKLKTTPNGKSCCEFRLAVPRFGNSQKADFLPIVAWEQTAEFICRNIVKGERILVRGELRAEDYTTQGGEKRTRYRVKADQVAFADGRERKSTSSPYFTAPADRSQDELPAAHPTAREVIGEIVDDEPTLPFKS